LLRSPVNRMGGKYYLTSWLSQYIPEHTCYVEPFCGAGHLLFSKEPSQVEVINDIDGHLIAFFRVLKDHEKRQKLIETLEYMPYSRALWQDIRSRWKAGNIPVDEIERAAWWYYLNSTCFGGDFRYGGFKIPSVTGRNPMKSFRNAITGMNTVAERLRNVCIENLSYAEVISRYDSEDTLFYCDPPYLNSEHYYGKGNFALDDHRTLAELLHDIKGHVMITHYFNEIYDSLYKGWHRYEYASFKGSHKAAPGTEKPKTVEVLYCNFEPLKTRGLFDFDKVNAKGILFNFS
jgi:DNA adenine methylase